MSKVKIITERLSSLSYQFAQEKGIHLIPANVVKDGDIFKDDDDAKTSQFLKELGNMDELPTTAVPSLGEMLDEFEKATKDTDQALYIATSSKLSGMYNLGKKAANEMKKKGKEVAVFDSYTTVSMEGMFAYEASLMANDGKDKKEIIKTLKKIKEENRIVEFGLLENLKYLEKGGRIGKAKLWAANLFSFKPIVSTEDGLLEPVKKVRTRQQGLDFIVDKFKNMQEKKQSKNMKIMYDYGLESNFFSKEVKKRIESEFDCEVISNNQISITLGCHLGPNVWGVCAYFE